jgi:hypothetical protein
VSFKLLDSGWADEIDAGVRATPGSILIVCPFIKRRTAERLLSVGPPADFRIVTRFDLNAFNAGVSDLDALELLLQSGAKIRGIVGVHSKMYVFGSTRAIVTSANLTESAMFKNKEFGFTTDDPDISLQCDNYFKSLWGWTKRDLTASAIEEWRRKLAPLRAGARMGSQLPDFGEVIREVSPFVLEPPTETPLQSFVKFFGRADNRASLATLVEEEVIQSGSHWACTYPKGKRPRQVQDGAVMFMARMVQARSDYVIYGRAIGRKHRPNLDDATQADLSLRAWKENWPHYVRVHDPIFVNGPLSAGVSMVDMMEELGAASFAPTQRNLARGNGDNINPRRAIMRKPHMELTPQACRWISERLDNALLRHGMLDLTKSRFDFPTG